jgi:glycosyltransferase involved in cell wall biosynthesis
VLSNLEVFSSVLSFDPSSLVANFITSDPALYSYYLVRCDEHVQKDTFESYFRFLLWMILVGRNDYRHPLLIPKAIRDIVSYPNDQGRHPLMNVVLSSMVGEVENRDQARAQYYFHALPKFALGPFVSRAELVEFKRAGGVKEFARLAAAYDPRGADSLAEHAHLADQLNRLASAKPIAALPSVSIVGFHRSVLGLGEDARTLFDCLLDAGIVAELVDVSPSSLEQFDCSHIYGAFEASRPNASVVIFCMPIFEMMRIICTLGLARASRQYWVGYWPWETTALDPGWTRSFEFVNEVWASSQFLYKMYGSQTNKPVFHVPLNVHIPVPMRPEEIGSLLDSKFNFISVFDFNSRIERKNPLGAIAAFRAAFPKGTEDTQLILKALHGKCRPDDFDTVQDAMVDDERIFLIDRSISRPEVCWLIQNSQAYLSLHRSEGFGRPLAEAMLLGTPVIGTGWSGSSDFLNDDTAFPIRYKLRPVVPTEYPFAAGEWAEPDIDHAADVMRRLYQQGGASPNITANAKRTVTKLFSRMSVSAKLVDRIRAIGHVLESDDQICTSPVPSHALHSPPRLPSGSLMDLKRQQRASLDSGPIELRFRD